MTISTGTRPSEAVLRHLVLTCVVALCIKDSVRAVQIASLEVIGCVVGVEGLPATAAYDRPPIVQVVHHTAELWMRATKHCTACH